MRHPNYSHNRPRAVAICSTILAGLLTGCTTLQLSQKGEPPFVEPNYMNYESVSVPALLQENWRYNATAGFGSVYPIIYGDNLVVANRRGEVHVVDIQSGKGIGVKRFGDALNGTPVISGFQMFVPVDIGTKAGIQSWNFRTGRSSWKIRSAPVATDLVAVGDNVIMVDIGSKVSSVSMIDGSILWEKMLDESVPVAASPVGCGDAVVVIDASGTASALDAETGRTMWTRSLDEAVYSRPASHDGTVFVATTRGGLDVLSCDTGAIRWSRSVTANNVRLSTPAVTPDEVVVAGTDGVVRAFSRSDGKDLWSNDIGSPIGAPPFVVANSIFVGTLNNHIVGLDRQSGTERWREKLEGRIKSGMAARHGELFVLAGPKFVYHYVTPIGDGTVGTK